MVCKIKIEFCFRRRGRWSDAGEELVILCTCDYGSADQRLLVVGRKKKGKGGVTDEEATGDKDVSKHRPCTDGDFIRNLAQPYAEK